MQIGDRLCWMENGDSSTMDLRYDCSVKVHRSLCLELKKSVDRISPIFFAIEAAPPRCRTGIEVLCSLHLEMDKAKLLIQQCSDSSKLYLVIRAEKILQRHKKICTRLELCLSQLQTMVPSLLAAQISGIVSHLKTANFHLDPFEAEAGKVLLALLSHDISASVSLKNLELEAVQFAALRLNLTSPVALLIEKRCIKKFLDKIPNTEPTKKKILKYLLYLLRKYGELIGQDQSIEIPPNEISTDHNQADGCGPSKPPREFKCLISKRLMYDPVIIASGRTFERVWIEEWIKEGNDTCPITGMKLEDLSLTPNSAMKGLISKWCLTHGITIPEPCLKSVSSVLNSLSIKSSCSISSFDSFMHELRLQTSCVSICSSDKNYSADSLYDKSVDRFHCKSPQMNVDPQRFHCSAISQGSYYTSQYESFDDMKKQLEKSADAWDLTILIHYVERLIIFLKGALELGDVKAQRDGLNLLLTILSKNSDKLPLHEDEFILLASFLDSEIAKEALQIMEALSRRQGYISTLLACGLLPSILKVLDTKITEFNTLSMEILCNLSRNNDMSCHIIYLDCIGVLVPFLDDPILAISCIKIIKNLCINEEVRIKVAETKPCIVAVARLLETGTEEEQEHVADVLRCLCSDQVEYIQVLLAENIVQYLRTISLDGSYRAKVIATELLQLLGHISDSDLSILYDTSNSGNRPKEKKIFFSNGFRFLRRKGTKILQPAISIFF